MTDNGVWQPISDALLRGAHHELNNRVASLSAVEQVISAGGETTALRAALVSELEKMRETIGLLGRVPLGAPSPVAPVRPQDLLASVVGLARLHHELREMEIELCCEGVVPPVRADPAAVERSLLVAVNAAARCPDAADAPGIRLACARDEGRVRITAAPLEPTTPELDAMALWLRASDGAVSRTEARALSLSLPCLGS